MILVITTTLIPRLIDFKKKKTKKLASNQIHFYLVFQKEEEKKINMSTPY